VLRHVVLLHLVDDVAPEQVDGIVAALERLVDAVPSIRGYQVGRDAGLDADNAHLAVVADFDDADGFAAYRDHPDHQRVLRERIRPVLQRRTALQFRTGD
jgi:hypothetical protein